MSPLRAAGATRQADAAWAAAHAAPDPAVDGADRAADGLAPGRDPSGRFARGVPPRLWGGLLLAGFGTIAAIQPGPEARPPTQPPWADAASAVTVVLLLASAAALLAGRRWAFGPASYAAGGLTVLSALCPTWQHHQVGAWWVAQSVISAALLAGSLYARSQKAGDVLVGGCAREAVR
ncbi:hypothetical protein I6A84_34810 [Frankia sp. CNm7]|uniref:Uncharacterized protein n=1 Tax=Frankia nepalensis TaxID=1836974 RepID=A0A937RAL8_9ACTN|nr:hypothetical protein [Frankia nepalensis]MBL7500424.1 hypothetical protein [Frankia nepalensis]MBL7511089.1 hypothetical protein [Frankia nepalensis]MBL7523120.1 hypothetical protein [Frankia nepalensis]MBL7626945.1 hypothetical protein [Frankia nepalensis]